MAYTKTTWTNGTTKLNAANMNNIEDGIGELKTLVSTMKSDILKSVYPIGSIYLSVNSVNPGTLFGGTWVAWGSGRVPVGINTSDTDFDTVEEIGGSKSVTLTSAQCGVPAHTHSLNNHVHGLNSHTHGLNNHKHSLGNHTHSVSAAMAFRVGVGETGRNRVAYGTSYYAFTSKDVDDLVYGTTASAATGNTGAASGSTAAASGNTAAASGNTSNNTTANASAAHTNLQPYIVCYMWKRTA